MIGLVIVVAGVAGVVLIVTRLPTHVWGTGLSVGIPVALPLLILVWQRQMESDRQLAAELREKKVPVYSRFVDFMFEKVYFRANNQAPLDVSEVADFLRSFTKDLTIWGSDDVVRSFGEWRRIMTVGSSGQPEGTLPGRDLLEGFESVLYAMRSDLGHKNKNLKQGNILCLVINDCTRILPAPKSRKTAVNHDHRGGDPIGKPVSPMPQCSEGTTAVSRCLRPGTRQNPACNVDHWTSQRGIAT